MSKSQLKRLQVQWYSKLKKLGFNDIEDLYGQLKKPLGLHLDEEHLEPLPNRTKAKYSSKTFKDSQAEYYRLAAQYLNDKEFQDKFHKNMWKLHSDGLSYQKISDITKVKLRMVRYYIEKMRKEFYK